jgi:hypothetical protein
VSQGRSGLVRNISPPPGLDPRTVQPVASRYTDWAIPAPESLAINNTISPGSAQSNVYSPITYLCVLNFTLMTASLGSLQSCDKPTGVK